MTDNDDRDSEKRFRFEEFKLLAETGREYFSFFLQGIVLWVAVIGAILKFYFDANPGSNARLGFFVFGIFVNIAAIGAVIRSRALYKTLAQRSSQLAEVLHVVEPYKAALGTSTMFLCFVIGAFTLWLTLFFLL